METQVKVKSVVIDLLMNEEPTFIGRGWSHKAKVISNSSGDEIRNALLGYPLWSEPIMSIEMFAVLSQMGKTIGLLLNNRKW